MSLSFNSLKSEYATLYSKAQLDGRFDNQIAQQVNKIKKNASRYQEVEQETGVPWYVVALIHNMEVSLRFDGHLHNGDPLSNRTINVPSGRPKAGSPPFSWEESAIDALEERQRNSWSQISSWSIPAILWRGENFNGWGYRQYREPVKTPYLWSGTTIYKKGKYVSDGRWDSNAISQQIGMAALLKEMENQGLLESDPDLRDYGLGCVDSGEGTNRTIVGTVNPSNNSDALTYALGVLKSDIEKEYFFNSLLDVSSIPEILNLKPQDKLQIKGFDEELDSDQWICDEICFYFGSSLQVDLSAYRGRVSNSQDPPDINIFPHSDPKDTNPSPKILKKKGVFEDQVNDIPASIQKAALATKGESTARGPGGGNVACAWAINKLVLPKAKVKPIGKVQVNVDSVEADLKANRGQQVSVQDSIPGDIAIMGAGSNAHIGVCLNNKCTECISNSSSRAKFVWVANLQTYANYYSKPSRIYRVIN